MSYIHLSFNHETSLSLTYAVSTLIPFLASCSLLAPPVIILVVLLPFMSVPPFSLPSKVEAVLDIPLLSSTTILDSPCEIIFLHISGLIAER